MMASAQPQNRQRKRGKQDDEINCNSMLLQA